MSPILLGKVDFETKSEEGCRNSGTPFSYSEFRGVPNGTNTTDLYILPFGNENGKNRKI
jgi:hypothetical protein